MLSNITVRLKLSDFINTDQEKSIMEMICKTHNDLRAVILLHMWFSETNRWWDSKESERCQRPGTIS